MKFVVFLLVAAGFVGVANAQCANGVCAVPQNRSYVVPSQPARAVYVAPRVQTPVYYGSPVYVAPTPYYGAFRSSCASGSCSAPQRSYYVPRRRFCFAAGNFFFGQPVLLVYINNSIV